jgi:hypothetical protein
MNDRPFVPVSPFAAQPLARRASLVGLGGALNAAFAAASPMVARKRKKDPNKRCKKQENPCKVPVLAMCVRNDIPEEICEESFLSCCRFFTTCNATQALDCLQFNGGPP